MPSALPHVSRRRVLIGAMAVALVGSPTTVACGSTPPVKDVDDLLGQLDRARSDARLAADAATAASPKVAAALTVVAAERTAHAKALTDEITRVSGDAPTTSTPVSSTAGSSTAATTSGPPPKPREPADVVASLQESATGAALLASQQSGYRAGLLGSIAAACTTAATVALAPVGPGA